VALARLLEKTGSRLSRLRTAVRRAANDLYMVNRKDGFVTPVDQPVILISQIQRSGGTLLSQLFDGHSAVHAHPHEICIGKPEKWMLRPLPPPLKRSAGRIFDHMKEAPTERAIAQGYYAKSSAARWDEGYPFCFNRAMQRHIFRSLLEGRHLAALTDRDFWDAYLSSYFNAWIDYQSLYGQSKKYVTGFTPRVNMDAESCDFFFATYPDGYLISIVRDPGGWYASSYRHSKSYQDADAALAQWKRSTLSSLELKRRWPDKVLLVDFRDLVADTEGIMHRLCARLDIPFEDALLKPTFNRMPILSDSAFEAKKGIDPDVLERARTLDPALRRKIDAYTPVYAACEGLFA
jgi:hypothetical protein